MNIKNHIFIIIYTLCPLIRAVQVIVYRPNDHVSHRNPKSQWSFGYTLPDAREMFTLYSDYIDGNCRNTDNHLCKIASTAKDVAFWYKDIPASDVWIKGIIGVYRLKNNTLLQSNEVLPPVPLMMFHPGPNNERPALRFSVPLSGFYEIQGTFFSPKQPSGIPDATTDAHLLINNVELGSLWVIRTPGILRVEQFYLEVGDFIQFEVGFGNNGNCISDSTFANIRIIYYDRDSSSCQCIGCQKQ